jgi:hypothetical protein
MTSVGATARHTGSHPRTGLPAGRTIVRLRGALDFAAAPPPRHCHAYRHATRRG